MRVHSMCNIQDGQTLVIVQLKNRAWYNSSMHSLSVMLGMRYLPQEQVGRNGAPAHVVGVASGVLRALAIWQNTIFTQHPSSEFIP